MRQATTATTQSLARLNPSHADPRRGQSRVCLLTDEYASRKKYWVNLQRIFADQITQSTNEPVNANLAWKVGRGRSLIPCSADTKEMMSEISKTWQLTP